MYILVKLEMCSVSTNGERASPAQQGSQLIHIRIEAIPQQNEPSVECCLLGEVLFPSRQSGGVI